MKTNLQMKWKRAKYVQDWREKYLLAQCSNCEWQIMHISVSTNNHFVPFLGDFCHPHYFCVKICKVVNWMIFLSINQGGRIKFGSEPSHIRKFLFPNSQWRMLEMAINLSFLSLRIVLFHSSIDPVMIYGIWFFGKFMPLCFQWQIFEHAMLFFVSGIGCATSLPVTLEAHQRGNWFRGIWWPFFLMYLVV